MPSSSTGRRKVDLGVSLFSTKHSGTFELSLSDWGRVEYSLIRMNILVVIMK